MSISSSLNAGVAGLNANAVRLATISDNIANSGTYGYKRAEADFLSMVIGSGTAGAGSFAAGGVRATTGRVVDQRGGLVGTSNATDIAVSGRGFLPVSSTASIGTGDTPLMLATTGSFRADQNGYLTTSSGLVLLGWPANPDGTIPTYPRDSEAALQPIQITANQYVGNPTKNITLGANLPATATGPDASGEPYEMSVEYFGNLGTTEGLKVTYTPSTTTPNQWTMTVRDDASGADIGIFELNFDDTAAKGGTLSSVNVTGGVNTPSYDAASGKLNVTTASGDIAISIGTLGSNSGLTQLSDTFSTRPSEKDGSPVGNLASVEFTADGRLNAIYDNGSTRTIYQVPVIDVPNPNGLQAGSNQTFRLSSQSGPMFLWDAGKGPVGGVTGFAQEESATDVASELTQLIQTQRAYSSNAKVIQTVDEMLQETTNIKR
ncbi:flagellar biosynthesis protein FlgE [Haematobacter massiliensis]|uniref:Flagellar hook protein FlgE n=1 Tax=Haematobacter massiliensis TaxID=195105 RepID=A0A086XZF3_9RHOB|nr:flagellar hook-basal body complex protein [Haematobacter massiliensis]KFI27403.1 flagellar hook protein FlgE [Haematobacter massiliensis]OWJ70824.1 flagellar biosynthesis protein FlgE [Haematobacter massiliensis]OWJ84853.1 flagellar biosynthesis protein FlgE [Haematobacter massiliensis]QBJ23854.1 flagellar hook-basal body complex protein [Haematobacter massiliensis]